MRLACWRSRARPNLLLNWKTADYKQFIWVEGKWFRALVHIKVWFEFRLTVFVACIKERISNPATISRYALPHIRIGSHQSQRKPERLLFCVGLSCTRPRNIEVLLASNQSTPNCCVARQLCHL